MREPRQLQHLKLVFLEILFVTTWSFSKIRSHIATHTYIKCVNCKLKLLIVGTGKYETHQENVKLPLNPHWSYQMPPPIPYNHHQQKNHIQQSGISQHQVHHSYEQMIPLQHPQGQHHHNHQQNVPLQSPMVVKCRNTPWPKNNIWFGSTTCKAKSQTMVLHSLPNCKIPANSPILWELSQDIREWKCLGKYLDLEEEIIEEIDYNTRPNRTRDKALKALTEWVNSLSPTWKTLGVALLDAKWTLLYRKLLKLLDKYAVGSPTTYM